MYQGTTLVGPHKRKKDWLHQLVTAIVAVLLIEVLRLQVAARQWQLHNFVIMPRHLHLLMTVPGTITVKRPCS